MKNQRGVTGIEFLVGGIILGISIIFFNSTLDQYDECHRVFDDSVYIYSNHYESGELMSSRWTSDAVRDRTEVMLDIKYPGIKKKLVCNVWIIWQEGRIRPCACSHDGRDLYVGCKDIKCPKTEIDEKWII